MTEPRTMMMGSMMMGSGPMGGSMPPRPPVSMGGGFTPRSMGFMPQSMPYGYQQSFSAPQQAVPDLPRQADLEPPPAEIPKVENSELRRQQIAMKMWQQSEEDLTRRVTMLENLIRRTVDIPAFDTNTFDRERQLVQWQDTDRGVAMFLDQHEGPLVGGLDSQVKDAEANKYYQHPRQAMLQAQKRQLQLQADEEWRNLHPITMTLAGDCQYVKRALYLDKPEDNDDLYWQSMNADYYRWRSMP